MLWCDVEVAMADVKIRRGDWLVVCDGAKAVVLENSGTAFNPKFSARATYEHEDPPTREIGTDAPRRVFQSVGGKRSAYEQADWHTQEEERFLTRLAERLDAAVYAGEAKSIILAAPPHALGIIRQNYSHTLRNALRAEVEKDFVRTPLSEIEKHFAWPM
jgi:protein required for attachment to host cells